MSHDPLLAIAVVEPCPIGAPLLHQLVDGELSIARTREAAEHAGRCPNCRDHLQWLELEAQAVREIAAPSPRRFVALWSSRLREKMVAAVTEEAGAELVRAAKATAKRATRSARPHAGASNDTTWQRSRDYLRQLADWLERSDLRPHARQEAILAGFAALLGENWPPLVEARAALVSAPRKPSRSR